jgi:hypothetical protein
MSVYVVEQRMPGSGTAAYRDWHGDAVFTVLEQAVTVRDRARRLWAVIGAEARVVDIETGAVIDHT